MKHIIALPMAFVILLSAIPCHSLDFSQGIGLRGGPVLSRAGGFSQKHQGAVFLELDNVMSGESFAAALTLGYHRVSASGLDGGWGYRGFEGFHGWLGAEWRPMPAAADHGPAPGAAARDAVPANDGNRASGDGDSAGDVMPPGTAGIRVFTPRFGVGAGIGGFFSRYQHTEILFFYPALRIILFADLVPQEGSFRLRFGLPAEIYLRRDLESSFSLGIGVWGALNWTRLRESRRRPARGGSSLTSAGL